MLVPRAFRSVCFSPVRIGLGPLAPPLAAQVKGNGDVTLCTAALSVFLLFLHINFCGAVPFAPSLKKSLLQRIKCNLEMLRLAFLSFPMIRGSSSASTLNRKHPSLAWAGKKIIVVSTAPGTKASPDRKFEDREIPHRASLNPPMMLGQRWAFVPTSGFAVHNTAIFIQPPLPTFSPCFRGA